VSSRVHPEALLGPESVSAQLLGHPAVLLGGPRALLLQLAHPSVAAAVAAQSSFEADPYRRLARTFAVMTAISFGAPADAAAARSGLAEVHRTVRGTTPAGVAYRAADPDLALWVHATLVDTLLAVERRYVGVLDDAGRARLYDESRRVAPLLGVPAAVVPPDLDAFERYVAGAAAPLLEAVSDEARALAALVLAPPPSRAFGPLAAPAAAAAGRLTRAVTVDLGPAALCRAYGLPPAPDRVDALAVAALARPSRLVSPWLPPALLDPWRLVHLTAWLAGGERDAQGSVSASATMSRGPEGQSR
jgi:uncharacterized protein (DUF2236 family)